MDNTINTGGSNRPVGPTIGLIIILLIIVIGGIYFWTSRKANAPQTPSQENQMGTSSSTESISNQSSSDDMTSINSDLSAYGETDINKTDSGL